MKLSTYLRTLAAALAWMICSAAVAATDVPLVAAASDLKFALEDIARRFNRDTAGEVQLVFGSSGNFYRQIGQGAPFQMFLSADESYVFKLADAGRTVDRGELYALGRIGIVVPTGSALKPDGELRDLAAAVADGRLKKFAIANPEHAPYGKRAEEALKHAGLWAQIRNRLVLGENIAQAAQFASSGETQGGIIAYSLATAPAVAKLGSFALIPANWHQPLRQRMVLIRGAGQTAQAFYHYLQQPAARKVMKQYGFAQVGEP